MPDSLLKQYQLHPFQQFLSVFWQACAVLYRIQDIEQLCTWAERKHLAHPQAKYQRLLIDEEHRLWKYERRSPYAVLLARCAVAVNSILFPTSRSVYRTGYAGKYATKH